MPNFKLGSMVRDQIVRNARVLTERRVDYALSDFPLTVTTIQCSVIEPHVLSLINQLKGHGYVQAPEVTDTTIFLSREQFPGLHRMVPLNLTLPEPIHTPKPVYYYPGRGGHGTVFEPSKTKDDLLVFLNLDNQDAKALTTWVNGVVRERRLQELTMWTVQSVLKECAGSGEVLATWPLLATLIDKDETFWRNRFRQPPRKLSNYAPRTHVMERYAKHMQGAEVVLTGALLLEDYRRTPGTIRPMINEWERLPNDKRYD
jgi:hypothetical protein